MSPVRRDKDFQRTEIDDWDEWIEEQIQEQEALGAFDNLPDAGKPIHIHRTDGLLMTVICKTFCNWVAQEEFLEKLKRENNGSYYVKTPNGYEQPHQAYYVARDYKRELLKWLPEAALTIPSFQKLKADQMTPQGDLFGDDPIEQFRQRKARMGLRAIPGGKTDGGED